MATVNVRFGSVMGAGAPVYAPIPRAAEAITTSATSAQATNKAVSGDYATVTSVGGAVWVRIGQNPTAAAGATDLIPDGGSRDFGPLREGDTVAVINA